MLRLIVPDREFFDEQTNEFVTINGGVLELEHSLASVREWEARHKKPFLGNAPKTREEVVDYIRCMSISEADSRIFSCLTSKNYKEIDEYIHDQKTATTFSKRNESRPSREIVTAEIIYYWMISLEIPFECQYWHLNQLLTLIRVCSIKNSKPQKMRGKDLAKHNTALNASRRAKLHSRG